MRGRDVDFDGNFVTTLAGVEGTGRPGKSVTGNAAMGRFDGGSYGRCASQGRCERGQGFDGEMWIVSGAINVWFANVMLTSAPVRSTAFSVIQLKVV